ncbi:MAG: EAL domain-containing protein [Pegethrix bostrychoides GSE-TBD4-15B]|jgi:diguanylate cyclase (GGDEF)-like protein/PAS domain S-box-containing protein|uniref:EAL domain-containing protein n=1 Tax=Pegethrix bostrychoides GSE-TBD4-15B TaxID=2839662 RepID=A0A951U6F6_9CYAN|nr:EAL domain-containing protein [Pegethrix bostrychoides GSE-TBD4-15B]
MRIFERQSGWKLSLQSLGHYWQRVLALILATLLILSLQQLGWGEALENQLYSSFFHWRGALPLDQSVAIVEVDQASLRQLQMSPWSRSLYRQLVDRLGEANPAVIALDQLFEGVDPEDLELATAIAQQRVVLAQAWKSSQPLLTSPTLTQAATALGHIEQTADPDGLVRSVTATVNHLPALGLAAIQVYATYTGRPIRPVQPQIWLNWENAIQQAAHYSAAEVLQGQLPPQQFRNKIVLVGSTLNRQPTPFDAASPAIYFQATLVSNLLQQDPLIRISRFKAALVLLLLTLVALSGARWHWQQQIWLWVSLGVAWAGLSWLAFRANLWLPVALPLIWLLSVGGLLLLIRFVTTFFELRQNATRYTLMTQGFNEGVWDWDLKTNRFYISPRWKQMIGYSEAALSDQPQEWFDRVHPLDRAALDAAITDYLAGRGSHFEQEYRLRHEDGSYRWMQGRGLAVFKVGKAKRLVGSQVDITAQKQAEEELWRSTFFDRLTELPSWTGFVDHLQQAIDQVQQDAQFRFAILWLDLDQFKLVNHSLGNSLGDRLLVAIAQRLKTFLPASEIVARLGEDEFAVLLRQIQDRDEVIRVAEQIQQELTRPFNLEEHEVFVTVSVGIALSAPYYAEPEHLLRDAGTAMYRAKAMGRASCLVFERSMRTGMLVKLRLESDLRRAIAQGMAQGERQAGESLSSVTDLPVTDLPVADRGFDAEFAELPSTLSNGAHPQVSSAISSSRSDELNLRLEAPPTPSPEQYPELELYYQPIVRLSTGQVTGFEALVRWQHAQQGLLFPSRFISMAEETGLIIPLSWWILRTACRQMSQWRQLFPENAALTMSVNLSSKQFSMTNLAEQIHQILQESQLEPTSLKLELTESMVMENAASVVDMLYQLRALGIRLAIDDFGTGYSSLSYLPRFPLTTLKIDRSFVEKIGDCNDNLEIVRTILALAHNLRMDVVAEGVETEAQATRLREMGCEYGQGFFFYKPLNVEAATQLLAK